MRMIAALCLVLALTACGVDSQRNAHVFDESEVPFGLADTAVPSTTVASGLTPGAVTTPKPIAFDLYFIRSNILVAVTRFAAATPSPADLVATLAAGPTQAEVTAGGHRSALTGPEIIAGTLVTSPIVTVDLAKTFNEIPRSDRILALGQITLTLTSLSGVTMVQYTIAEMPIEVPKANGVVTRDPVTREDYSALLQSPNASPVTIPSTTTSPPATSPPTSGP